jgi:hypothetical protein
MTLEAVWFQNGEEVFLVEPVQDLICDDKITSICDIEVYNGYGWYQYPSADDFVIRVKKEK